MQSRRAKQNFFFQFHRSQHVEIGQEILKAAKFFRETEAKRLRLELRHPTRAHSSWWQNC
jgi:hypothetical protein